MDRAEFERIKEEEKQHLREIMGLKKKLGEVQQKAKIFNALKGVGLSEESQNTYDEMMERLTRSNIESEARMDVALENAGIAPVSTATPQVPQVSEEEMQKLRAAELVKQMKLEMGGPMMPSNATATTSSDASLDRTIGKMPKPATEDADDEAENTSGNVSADRSIGKVVKKGI
jgi:hypothetical protein